ncbi:phosphatase PAP2 family protein [Streptomyces spiralis]|uniref:phosphatase PAP2 family protein n=1 Tax=Streptomyces spiralis TaxID=66376 RepID=UPI0036A03C4F
MAWLVGRRGRKAAATGLAAVVVAQLVSNGLCKQLADRPRPPKECFPRDEVDDRPDSSSFPSGHTAAAVAFTAAIAPTWPATGAVCADMAAPVRAPETGRDACRSHPDLHARPHHPLGEQPLCWARPQSFPKPCAPAGSKSAPAS